MAKIKSIKNFLMPDCRKTLLFVILVIVISLLTYFSIACHPEFNTFAFVYLIILVYSLIGKGLFPGIIGVFCLFFVYFLSSLIVSGWDAFRRKTTGSLQQTTDSKQETTDN